MAQDKGTGPVRLDVPRLSVGYLMLWNATEADPKFIGVDGKQHTPTELIIDGQQRLTSLYAVMKGAEITFKNFSRGRIS
jgi:hypothetical protein